MPHSEADCEYPSDRQMSYGSYHHDMGHSSLTTVWRLLNIRCTNLERKEGKHAGQETGTGTGCLFSG